MAKYINNKIKSGRVAGSVFAVRYGEVIERAYNPYVTNPKSSTQVEARAKMKLLSQLGAVVAPILAMPRQGAVSSRNRFVKVNYGLVSYSNLQADIDVNSIRLTDGVVGIPPLVVSRDGADLTARLTGSAGVGLDQMVYALFIKGNDNQLRYAQSQVVTTPGTASAYPTTFPITNNNDTFVVLAYGVRFNTEDARLKYGNLTTNPAETIAKLIVTRSLVDSDITVTETRGATSNPV